MRYFVRGFSTLAAYLTLTFTLTFTSLAVAQTTTTEESPHSQSHAAANAPTLPSLAKDSTQPPAPAPTSPTAPVTPMVHDAPPAAASTAKQSATMPPAPDAPRIRSRDCASNWIRGGFYMRIGSGVSDVSLDGSGSKGSASISGLGSNSLIAIGGSIFHGLVLAGTIQGSGITSSFDGGPFKGESVTSNGPSLTASSKADAQMIVLGLLVDWYPNPSDGWHAGLSTGVGLTSIKNDADDSTMNGSSAAGSIFGGYDWAIGPEWSLGLALVGAGARSTSLKDASDHPHSGYRLKTLSLGISASVLYF
jgi:hypothetical protein